MTAVLGEGVHAVHLTPEGVLLVDGVPVENPAPVEAAPYVDERRSHVDDRPDVPAWAQPTPRELPLLVFPAAAPDPDAVLRAVP